jgi:hypothetical protein
MKPHENGHKKGAPHTPRSNSNPGSLMKIVPTVEPRRTWKMRIERRGGSGPAAKLDPEPRTKHIPKSVIQGVRW